MLLRSSLNLILVLDLAVLLFAQSSGAEITFQNIHANLPGVYAGSVAWGDYDNDGRLDILLTGITGSGYISRIYRNAGATFNDIGAGLPGVCWSSAAWGDYDKDGRLDLVLSGYVGPGNYVSRVYRNAPGGFQDINAGLLGVFESAAAWGDYDGDGDLDLLLSGAAAGDATRLYANINGFFTYIPVALPNAAAGGLQWFDYDNDGDLDALITGSYMTRICRNDAGTFDHQIQLPGLYASAVAVGDYDNDGDLDLLVTGKEGSELVSRIYRNDGGTFTDINAGLPGVWYGAVAWGDYDNDGDLDILLTGDTGHGYISLIYRNDNGVFTPVDVGLPGVAYSAVAWGDYDNDGDLDILLTGESASSLVADIYQNNGAQPNTPPEPPDSLSAQVQHRTYFRWTAGSDGLTPTSGLTYHLRIGHAPATDDIMPAMADLGSGFRRVVGAGNAQCQNSWTVSLPTGSYYWSVQAVDGGYAGSRFATPRRVDVTPYVDMYRWALVDTSEAFSHRDGAGAVAFRDTLWLLGGWTPATTNEIWYSRNGISWQMLPPDPLRWERRHTAGYVVFNNMMWIVGGDANTGHYQSDVWKSADGRNWQKVADNVPWGPRVLHCTVVHNGKIWVMGGQTLPQLVGNQGPDTLYNDVWNSTDGIHWNPVIRHAPWSPRGEICGSVEFNGKMWVIGGGTYETPRHPVRKYYNDVWCSDDGITWTRILKTAPWQPREYQNVAVFAGRMWVLGGSGWGDYNLQDVWYSNDGVEWLQVEDTPWPPRHAGSVFVRPDTLWMVAGNMWHDVWSLVRTPENPEGPLSEVGWDVMPRDVKELRLRVEPPNPSDRASRVEYGVPAPGGMVAVRIYDVNGRVVRTMVNRSLAGGTYAVEWRGDSDSGRKAPAGVYLCRLEVGGKSAVVKVVRVAG